MWEVEVGEEGGGESGTEKNPPSLHHRMTPGLFEHHRLIILDTEKVDFFCNLLNSLFFFSMELLPAFTDGKTVSSDGEFCRRIITWCGGGEGSAWILLPAGSTSFPLHRSLNTATDFKDIRLHCHSRGMKLYLLSPRCSGNRIPPNFSIKFDFFALLE